MRGALLLGLAAVLLGGCDLLSGDFKLSGTVAVAPRLRERVPKENAMLFVVVKNEGGVPVAVHRIVNPDFPAPFRMRSADLLVPAVRGREPLTVAAELNTHGDVGHPRPGDLLGGPSAVAYPGDGGVAVTLDRVAR